MPKKLLLFAVAGIMAAAMACGGDTKSPVAPSTAPTTEPDAAADGSTLKVTAPTQVTPADAATNTTLTPTLTVGNSTAVYVPTATLTYRFAIETAAGAAVLTSSQLPAGPTQTSMAIAANTLKYSTAYRWRARAEQNLLIGPWSSYRSFTTMAEPPPPQAPEEIQSYQTSTELWDRLSDGKTLGSRINSVFIAGKGIQLPDFSSYVRYTLGSTLTSGQMSFIIENIDADTNGAKTKVVTMQEGYTDFTANDFRFNVEKRGDDHPDSGKFRMRIITGNPEDEFYDSDRFPAPLSRTKTYFMKVVWGGGRVVFTVQDNNETGRQIVYHAFSYQGTYRPSPHVVQLGVPTPRGGALDATVPGMIFRNFFVGPTTAKRPGTAGFLPELDLFGFDGPGGL